MSNGKKLKTVQKPLRSQWQLQQRRLIVSSLTGMLAVSISPHPCKTSFLSFLSSLLLNRFRNSMIIGAKLVENRRLERTAFRQIAKMLIFRRMSAKQLHAPPNFWQWCGGMAVYFSSCSIRRQISGTRNATIATTRIRVQ